MDNINTNELDLSVLDTLTPAEKQLALSILKEYSEEGKSQKYVDLLLDDYAETPVDIETFLHDPEYLGKGLTTDEGRFTVFPYWVNMLKKLFPNNLDTAYNTLILSGAIGLGKSFVAVIAMLYMLYRMLCLKDPYKHYGLQPIDHITFSLMNITLDAAKGVAWSKIQELLQLSPWFMRHGTVNKSLNPTWQPNSNIELIFGSQPRHVIGRAVFCLSGDTEIITPNGIIKLEDAANNFTTVYSVDDQQQISISETCKVIPTIKTDVEYEIELEDGTTIHCTPNHKFMLQDGTYKEAQNLTLEDELAETKPFGYIYCIENKVNKKRYIGQSIHPKVRFEQHIRAAFKETYPGYNYPIHQAIRKYGVEAFELKILDAALNKTDLNELEKKWINLTNSQNPTSGYNIAEGGQGGDGGPAVRAKIQAAHKGVKLSKKHCLSISKAQKGKKLSSETREKISQANKGKKRSIETRYRISIGQKKRDKLTYYKNTLKGKKAITDGTVTKYIQPEEPLPDGFIYGNCKTKGLHDTSRWTVEMHQRRSALSAGKNNPMYGKGFLVSGGKNPSATIRYFYKSQVFECRKDLVQYLEKNEQIKIAGNTIRKIVEGTYKTCIKRKYSEVIKNLHWEIKT